MSFSGVSYNLVSPNARVRIGCPIGGLFGVINSVEAVAAAMLLGVKAHKIKDVMPLVQPIPGRMERVALPADMDCSVFIDYAHTPDALENLLKAVQRMKMRAQRVVLVFGCGGDRDRGKRAQMGQIASRYADYTVITADNSRGEQTSDIIADIIKGVDRRAHYRVIRDRREAIRHVIAHARRGDVILLAGKGHEDYQEIKGVKYPFDERDVIKEVLQALNK